MGYKIHDSKESELIVKTKAESIHLNPMILNGVSIELHTRLSRKVEVFNLDISELWSTAVPITINNTPVFTLNTTNLLIHLCIHTEKHFYTHQIQFTSFNDITNLLERVSETLDWDELIRVCTMYNCEDIVFRYILLVNKYMKASVPGFIIDKYSKLLNPDFEEQFCKFLSGYTGYYTAVPFHLKNIQQLGSVSERLRYFWDVLFPSKAFMIQKYALKDSRQSVDESRQNNKPHTKNFKLRFWWLWYLYRYYKAIVGAWKSMIGSHL